MYNDRIKRNFSRTFYFLIIIFSLLLTVIRSLCRRRPTKDMYIEMYNRLGVFSSDRIILLTIILYITPIYNFHNNMGLSNNILLCAKLTEQFKYFTHNTICYVM